MINGFSNHKERHEQKGTGFKWQPKTKEDIANCLRANGALYPTDNSIKVNSATSKGYETAKEGDTINLSQPNSETRRGRVGKQVAQTLDTACNQGVITEPINATYRHSFEGFKGYNDLSPTIKISEGSGNQILLNNIRRLTPKECFRLMDFPDTFKWSVSDTQAYKQAGNSIVVNVLAEIINKLKL